MYRLLIWANVNPFYRRTPWFKFGWNLFDGSGEKKVNNIYKYIFLTILLLSPPEKARSFIWTNLNAFTQTFSWIWIGGSRGEDENVKMIYMVVFLNVELLKSKTRTKLCMPWVRVTKIYSCLMLDVIRSLLGDQGKCFASLIDSIWSYSRNVF